MYKISQTDINIISITREVIFLPVDLRPWILWPFQSDDYVVFDCQGDTKVCISKKSQGESKKIHNL